MQQILKNDRPAIESQEKKQQNISNFSGGGKLKNSKTKEPFVMRTANLIKVP